MFQPEDVFQTLYKDSISQACRFRVLGFEESRDVVLRSGFISSIEDQLQLYFQESVRGKRMPSSEIHRGNLRRFENNWRDIHSSSTCLACLRRRPQYGLPCGHIVCENCVLVFGECCVDDPWIFKLCRCFLCGLEIPKELVVRVHPPTAGAGVLCIDGGGTRGVLPLEFLKRIQDRIGLQIPIQKFFKLVLGTSSGKCSPDSKVYSNCSKVVGVMRDSSSKDGQSKGV